MQLNEQAVTYDRYGRMNYHPGLHHNQKKPWVISDQKYLIENYERVGPTEISLALGRTIHTVMTRVYELRKKGLMARPLKKNVPPAQYFLVFTQPLHQQTNLHIHTLGAAMTETYENEILILAKCLARTLTCRGNRASKACQEADEILMFLLNMTKKLLQMQRLYQVGNNRNISQPALYAH
jgi:hypothetical protein